MNIWGTLVVGFFGGGIVSGFIGAWANSKRERSARRAEFLARQLQDLYGPLQFLASSSASLFEQTHILQKLYNKEYIETKYSQNPGTQERVRESAETTIEVQNDYVELAIRNSDSAAQLLERNYALVDPGDAEVFGRFLVDVARRKVETDSSGVQRLPFEILIQRDAFSFMSSEFIKAVASRFEEKRADLEKLQGRGGS